MKNNKLPRYSKLWIAICSVVLIIVLFFPIWQIQLAAPQYPEGLVLKIHANKLAGNVDVINGLNHYIGMKSLHTSDFFEFTILPYIIGFFALLLLITAIAGNRSLLNIVFALFVCFGIIAMIDFWKWDYNYGHNLNPDAAIIVPGMAYQPPLIGYKQLLNFGAYSIPDIGGWLFISVGVILMALVIFAWSANKEWKKNLNPISVLMPLIPLLMLSSCNTSPQPIVVGKDQCDFCKMPISDARFGAEVITKKGKVFKFDDEHCLHAFLLQPAWANKKNHFVYFVDFSDNHTLIPATNTYFLKSNTLRSPMNGNVAAFSSMDSLKYVNEQYPGDVLSLNQLLQP